MTTPPAGSWIRPSSPPRAWSHWHLFTGDMTWHPEWLGPSLDTACGYTTSPETDIETIEVALEAPLSPCRRCLALAGRPEAAH